MILDTTFADQHPSLLFCKLHHQHIWYVFLPEFLKHLFLYSSLFISLSNKLIIFLISGTWRPLPFVLSFATNQASNKKSLTSIQYLLWKPSSILHTIDSSLMHQSAQFYQLEELLCNCLALTHCFWECNATQCMNYMFICNI